MNQTREQLLKIGLNKLLKIKDSDIRITTLKQGDQAVDRGIHMGGAFSVTVPIVSLFYGGYMNLDVEDPTRIGQDIFVLSKGHAVATMASIYADLGYFDPSILANSRSVESILNGHPGPVLPGVHIATGPLGQGVAVAHGFAMAGKHNCWRYSRGGSVAVYCQSDKLTPGVRQQQNLGDSGRYVPRFHIRHRLHYHRMPGTDRDAPDLHSHCVTSFRDRAHVSLDHRHVG